MRNELINFDKKMHKEPGAKERCQDYMINSLQTHNADGSLHENYGGDKMKISDYHQALIKCAIRYKTMIIDFQTEELYWNGCKSNYHKLEQLMLFVYDFEKKCLDEAPICKMNRWLGYIQGVLISEGITTIEKERDWTRSLFKPLDYNDDSI